MLEENEELESDPVFEFPPTILEVNPPKLLELILPVDKLLRSPPFLVFTSDVELVVVLVILVMVLCEEIGGIIETGNPPDPVDCDVVIVFVVTLVAYVGPTVI